MRINQLATVVGFVVIFIAACVGSPYEDALSAESAESQSEEIRLYFNPPLDSLMGNQCESQICASLLEQINASVVSIDFAVYGMRNQTILLDALLEAKERGVQVRGVVDRDSNGLNYYTSTDDWVEQLVAVRDDYFSEEQPGEGWFGGREDPCPRPEGRQGPLQCLAYDFGSNWILAEHASSEDFSSESGGSSSNLLMHNKFFIFDNQSVWTGSTNISDTGTGGYNANIAVVVSSSEIAARYTIEFESMWSGRFHGDKPPSQSMPVLIGEDQISVYFSPQDDAMVKGILPLIAASKETVNVSVFYLTDKRVTAELLAAHRRGVQVRIILDATAAQNGYSKHEVLRLAGVPVKVETWGGKMHMKSASIDGTHLIVGSMNWTGAGNRTNDENTLIISSAELAAAHNRQFEVLWASIEDRWSTYGSNPLPESQDSVNSCLDGIDNDFDGLADGEDPGCTEFEPGAAPMSQHVLKRNTSEGIPDGYNFVPSIGSPTADRAASCDGNYSGICLPIFAVDIDCGQLGAKDFVVVGQDRFELDGNSDGEACESY